MSCDWSRSTKKSQRRMIWSLGSTGSTARMEEGRSINRMPSRLPLKSCSMEIIHPWKTSKSGQTFSTAILKTRWEVPKKGNCLIAKKPPNVLLKYWPRKIIRTWKPWMLGRRPWPARTCCSVTKMRLPNMLSRLWPRNAPWLKWLGSFSG